MASGVGRVKRECVTGRESQIERRHTMTYRIAFPLLALLVAGGCSGSDATDPMSPNTHPAIRKAVAPALSESFPRSGDLHATKNCSTYTGLAGSFCTITSSNLKAIEIGTASVRVDLRSDRETSSGERRGLIGVRRCGASHIGLAARRLPGVPARTAPVVMDIVRDPKVHVAALTFRTFVHGRHHAVP